MPLSVDEIVQRMRAIVPGWCAAGTAFDAAPVNAALRARLPNDYVSLLRELGPGEGFVGCHYLRLCHPEELAAANRAYDIATHLPDHILIGSDGGGNAFFLDTASEGTPVDKIPFIPLDRDFGETVAEDFLSFLDALLCSAEGDTSATPLSPNPKTFGLEIHEKHPVVLGGDPTDPANKMLLRPSVHAEASVYFNRLVRTIRERS
jgi:hypothetical protein